MLITMPIRRSDRGRPAIAAPARRGLRLVPRTVRGRATAVVTTMTALALAVSAGVLLYVVRHELVGVALVAADDSATTEGPPDLHSHPIKPPQASSPPDTDTTLTGVPPDDVGDLDFTLIDTAQDTMIRLMLLRTAVGGQPRPVEVQIAADVHAIYHEGAGQGAPHEAEGALDSSSESVQTRQGAALEGDTA